MNQPSPLFVHKEERSFAGVVVNVRDKKRSANIATGFIQPELGPRLKHDKLFPERANIGFAEVLAPDRIRLRVWERGAGLTLACGSGACAALVNAHRRGLAGRRAIVVVDGGELDIEWRSDGHVLMTGPVATSFIGEIDLAAYPA